VGVTIEPVECDWSDPTDCGAFASAYCGDQCEEENECMLECDETFADVVHEDGAMYTAWGCTLKISCP